MLRLPPSSMFRTVKCAGWAAASKDAIKPESDYTIASEGIAIHTLLEKALKENIADFEPFIGTTDDRGVVYTEEMIDGAVTMLEILYGIVTPEQLTSLVWGTETWLKDPVISTQTIGKPDFYCYDAVRGIVDVVDFKWGYAPVEAVENWQLLSYAVLLKSHLKIVDDVEWRLTVIQPRCFDGSGSRKQWTTRDLEPYLSTMRVQTTKALLPNPELVTGEHCKHCPAAYRCLALRKQSTELIEVMVDGGTYTELDMMNPTAEMVGNELTALKRAQEILKNKVNAMESHAEILLTQGQDVRGWQLKDRKSAAKWLGSIEEVRGMAMLFGVSFDKPSDIVSPTQAKAILKKNSIDEAVISGYTGHDVTKVLSKFDINYAKQVFGGQQ